MKISWKSAKEWLHENVKWFYMKYIGKMVETESLFLFMYMQFFILSLHWKYSILYFGKHDKGDKSYKFMLQVANFQR